MRIAALFIALPLLAQPARHTPAQRYELFQKHLAIRAAAITQNQFQGVHNLDDWKRRRPEIRRQFLDMLGLHPLPPRTPLNVRITGERRQEGYRVQNIVFESKPGLYVTGNLYLPLNGTKFPGVVYVSGHKPGPEGAKAGYRHHGVWMARNGYAAFLLDTIEFGEIPGIHHGIHNLGMWHWLSLGYTPAGVEVWNAIRALDYLETRGDVDTSKAAITGISGGGAVTWFTAAADDRFQVAAPVLATWSVGPHVADDVVKENCDCIYFWNSHRLDLPVVGALIAPRPLNIVNASKDSCFPPAGYQTVYEKVRRVYEWYNAADKLAAFDAPTQHADLPPFRKAANEWLNRWIRNNPEPFDESRLPEQDPAELTVLDKYPANALNEGIHRSFVPPHRPAQWSTRADWERRRRELIETLEKRVFGAFPSVKAPFDTWKAPHRMWTERYADSYNVEFTTEESIRVHGQLFVPRNGKPSHPALIYVKGKEDIIFSVDYDHLLSAFRDHVVLVLNPRAVDYPMDVNRTSVTKMSIALLGSTLESMQLWDLLRSVDFLQEQAKLTSISVYGRRQMGALAIYAAALDTRISQVILDDPPASHWQGPSFLHVLRHTDLPEVSALVAPREIVSLTAFPQSFQYTNGLLRFTPGSAPLREAASLADALRVWRIQ